MKPSQYLSTRRRVTTSKIIVIFWIIIFWFVLAFYQYFDRYTVLLDRQCLGTAYSHWPYIKGLLLSMLLGGPISGAAIVFLWERWLRNMSFFKALFYIVMWYTTLYILLTSILTLTFDGDNSPLAGKEFHEAIIPAVFDPNLLPNFFFWLGVMFMTMFLLLVRDKFGPTVFVSFLAGKYFRPRNEERIFMFMDLKSSTTIAEQLGELQYFRFLNDAFKTATPAIVASRGEIYQYVGDEIVISWPMKVGLREGNCVRCFTEMTMLLTDQTAYFESNYGFKPQFKAGMHAGPIVAGEMGTIKREIVYTGDVLNTASRIQSECNQMGVDLLMSRALEEQVSEASKEFAFHSLGAVTLRGKSEAVELMTILLH